MYMLTLYVACCGLSNELMIGGALVGSVEIVEHVGKIFEVKALIPLSETIYIMYNEKDPLEN